MLSKRQYRRRLRTTAIPTASASVASSSAASPAASSGGAYSGVIATSQMAANGDIQDLLGSFRNPARSQLPFSERTYRGWPQSLAPITKRSLKSCPQPWPPTATPQQTDRSWATSIARPAPDRPAKGHPQRTHWSSLTASVVKNAKRSTDSVPPVVHPRHPVAHHQADRSPT